MGLGGVVAGVVAGIMPVGCGGLPRVASRWSGRSRGQGGVFLQDRGGQEMSSACLRGGECLEAPEPGKQEVGPGVVGLVAQDGAAGVAGDDGGDTHQPQPDRPGLPPTGSSGGQGEQLGEGEDVAGQGHDQAPGAGGQVLEHLGVIRT